MSESELDFDPATQTELDTAVAGITSNTLDEAYDEGGAGAGRTITADAGAVEILGAGGLTVAGTIQSGSSITIDGTTGSEDINSTGDLDLQTGGTSRLFIESTGEVGIGTDTPTEALTVAGTVESTSGGFKFPDGSVQTSAGSGAAGPSLMRIALLKWYDTYQPAAAFSVGDTPLGVAFDGVNIWVSNYFGCTVTKLRASDGEFLGEYPVSPPLGFPRGIAFDGANIWVAISHDDDVAKLRASDGEHLGEYDVGNFPESVAFDGVNIWVTNYDAGTVSKLRAGDGAILGTYDVGAGPSGVAFDGVNILVTNSGDGTVSKL